MNWDGDEKRKHRQDASGGLKMLESEGNPTEGVNRRSANRKARQD